MNQTRCGSQVSRLPRGRRSASSSSLSGGSRRGRRRRAPRRRARRRRRHRWRKGQPRRRQRRRALRPPRPRRRALRPRRRPRPARRWPRRRRRARRRGPSSSPWRLVVVAGSSPGAAAAGLIEVSSRPRLASRSRRLLLVSVYWGNWETLLARRPAYVSDLSIASPASGGGAAL